MSSSYSYSFIVSLLLKLIVSNLQYNDTQSYEIKKFYIHVLKNTRSLNFKITSEI